MYTLVINAYHGGASPCLIRDGQLIAGRMSSNLSSTGMAFPQKLSTTSLMKPSSLPCDLASIGNLLNPSAYLPKKLVFNLYQRTNFNLIKDRFSSMACGLNLGATSHSGSSFLAKYLLAEFFSQFIGLKNKFDLDKYLAIIQCRFN